MENYLKVQASTFRPTGSMISAAKTVFAAKAYEAVIRQHVERYQMNILFLLGYDGDKMLHPYDMTYTMSDTHQQEYSRQCKENRDKLGLKVANPNFCPLLVAKSMTRDAERALVDVCCDVLFIDIDAHRLLCSGLENYNEFVELQLQFLVKFI